MYLPFSRPLPNRQWAVWKKSLRMLLSETVSAFPICWFGVEAKLCSSRIFETELNAATESKASRENAHGYCWKCCMSKACTSKSKTKELDCVSEREERQKEDNL